MQEPQAGVAVAVAAEGLERAAIEGERRGRRLGDRQERRAVAARHDVHDRVVRRRPAERRLQERRGALDETPPRGGAELVEEQRALVDRVAPRLGRKRVRPFRTLLSGIASRILTLK